MICLLPSAAMFITVMFGAGCQELVNPWCSLANFTMHLKRKARLPPEVAIALLAEDGHLVKLEEVTEAPSMACSLLQEQGTYVLVQVIKGKDGSPAHYESLLDNLDDQYPELAGFPGPSRGAALALRLSNPKQWSEKTPGYSAWPPGTRSLFKVSKGHLPIS